jgi:hypothetical protein
VVLAVEVDRDPHPTSLRRRWLSRTGLLRLSDLSALSGGRGTKLVANVPC